MSQLEEGLGAGNAFISDRDAHGKVYGKFAASGPFSQRKGGRAVKNHEVKTKP